MSISFTNYVDITSGVVGTSGIKQRQLITRIFSVNPLIPANSFAEFSSAADVASYFGTSSVEYAIAVFYFGWLNKSNRSPQLLSFASWVQANRQPSVYGDPTTTLSLAALQAITNGSLDLTLGATTATLAGISFAAAGSFTAVAAALQTLIRAGGGSDPEWTGATVTYNPTSPIGPNFSLIGGGSTGTGTIAVHPVTGEADVGAALGWESVNAIFSQGALAASLTATMIATTAASTNFATFAFIPTLDQSQITELATWLSTTNISYMYLPPVTASDAAAISAALIEFAGIGMTLSPVEGQYPELIPGMILAATDYTSANASQSYMYQQFAGINSTVTDDADSETYDQLRVNYYGMTQQAGQQISFYQRGVLTGLTNSPSDMNVYANEIWFKSYVGDILISALLTLNEIPANTSGRATILGLLQSAIDLALINGTISVGNTLTPTQINSITQITNDNNAWRQVQTTGYWINVYFTSIVTDSGTTEYQGNYTLVYTKNNAIRKIIGTHDLI